MGERTSRDKLKWKGVDREEHWCNHCGDQHVLQSSTYSKHTPKFNILEPSQSICFIQEIKLRNYLCWKIETVIACLSWILDIKCIAADCHGQVTHRMEARCLLYLQSAIITVTENYSNVERIYTTDRTIRCICAMDASERRIKHNHT